MAIQPLALQVLFADVLATEKQIQTLNAIEEHLIEISDFLGEQQYPVAQLLNDVRPHLQRLRRQLKFLMAMQLLQCPRRLQEHLRRHNRLPVLDLHV